MKLRISESSYVIDFLSIDYDSKFVKEHLANELNNCLKKIEIPTELDDWTLEFTLLYNNAKCLGIARKTKSVKSLKLKEVVIHIPIPRKAVIDWGVRDTQLIRETQFDKRYVDELNVGFQKYTNRTDYIIDNAKRAIHFALELGIRINGNSIKK